MKYVLSKNFRTTVCSAPEVFQCQMNHILSGLHRVLCHVNDILVFGTTIAEHDSRLNAVLERTKTAGITLNVEKCQFSQPCITFLGHVIDHNGISLDPKKTDAILAMKPPTSITELRWFMGMVNQITKFSPNIAHFPNPQGVIECQKCLNMDSYSTRIL